MPRKKDTLTILEEAKAAAIPKIVENLRRAASEMVAAPALGTKVPPAERRLRYHQMMAETERALSSGLPPDSPGTLGELIRQEQQKYGLDPNQVPLSVLDYIANMNERD